MQQKKKIEKNVKINNKINKLQKARTIFFLAKPSQFIPTAVSKSFL